MGHYSALKGNEVLIHATTLTNLGNIRRLTPRATYHMIPFIENVQNRQHHRHSRSVVAKGWSGCGMKYLDRDSDYRQLGFTHGIKLHSSLQTHIHMRESQYKPGKI